MSTNQISHSGVYPVLVRQSAATAAGQVVWAIHNPDALKIIHIRSALFQLYFDGVAAATLMKYELVKYTGVTVFSGGAVVTPLHKATELAAGAAGVCRLLDTGLTLTNGVAQSAVQIGVMGRVTQTATNFAQFQSSFLGHNERGPINHSGIQLSNNEALAIRIVGGAAVIGDNINGYVEAAVI